MQSSDVKTLFIVDDSPLMQERIKSLVAKNKLIKILGVADNVDEAIDRIEELKPSLLLVDIKLIDSSGFDLLRYVQDKQSGIYTIVLTNYDIPEYREESLKLGAKHFLVKNRDFRKITDILEEL